MDSGYDRTTDPGDVSSVGRTWPGIVVANVDGDGRPEIVTAHGGGYVSVYDHQGYFQNGWPQRPITRELRGLSVYDLDADGTMEIIVTGALGSRTNTWVYEHDGTLRQGWPQLSNDSGYAWGVFNDNAAIGDLDGDGVGEIVVPSDVHYVCAYEPNGVQIPAHSMYGDKDWGRVGVHVDHAVDLRGWAYCGTEHRPNFAHTPAAIVDVNGDGVLEAVVMGNVYNCGTSPYSSLYEMAFIFNADRTRWGGSGFDWTAIPVPDGNAGPISESWSTIESNMTNPVPVDLDGDGYLEILYPSYDGRLHAYWLDKTEHGNWPYWVYNPGEGFRRFASEPVVADLDADGHAEVIFTSWVQKETYRTGKLHILDYLGNPLQELDLPPAYGSPDWNGGLAAPTLANLDADADLEVVVNTSHSGFVAYDLPGTANARVLWGTSRGNYQRTASVLHGNLKASTKGVSPHAPAPGDKLTYTIRLENPGPALSGVHVTDTIPLEVHYLGDLWASAGSYGEAGGVVTWTGTVETGEPIIITYGVTVSLEVATSQVIASTALIDDGRDNVLEREASVIVNGYMAFVPVIYKR
jgi:uncharacterized repeat protein (TIGR01451 family)